MTWELWHFGNSGIRRALLCQPCYRRGLVTVLGDDEYRANLSDCCLACWRIGWAVIWIFLNGDGSLRPWLSAWASDRVTLPRAYMECGCECEGTSILGNCPTHRLERSAA